MLGSFDTDTKDANPKLSLALLVLLDVILLGFGRDELQVRPVELDAVWCDVKCVPVVWVENIGLAPVRNLLHNAWTDSDDLFDALTDKLAANDFDGEDVGEHVVKPDFGKALDVDLDDTLDIDLCSKDVNLDEELDADLAGDVLQAFMAGTDQVTDGNNDDGRTVVELVQVICEDTKLDFWK